MCLSISILSYKKYKTANLFPDYELVTIDFQVQQKKLKFETILNLNICAISNISKTQQ